jgi:hypothetical protein
LASGVSGISRDDVYAALSEDYTDGLPDGKSSTGSSVTITSDKGGSLSLPVSTLGFDLSAELGAVKSYTGGAFSGAGAASAGAALAPNVGTTVTAIVPTTVAASTGISSSSSGAMSYYLTGGKQYLFVAARTKGVRKIDITDPAAAVEITSPAWAGASITSKAGFSSQPIGGAMVVSGSSGTYVLAFAYAAKYIVLLNPDTGVVEYEGTLPIVATSTVSFSGGSAFIAGAIPDPGKGAWLAAVFLGALQRNITPTGVQIAIWGDIARTICSSQ